MRLLEGHQEPLNYQEPLAMPQKTQHNPHKNHCPRNNKYYDTIGTKTPPQRGNLTKITRPQFGKTVQ
jgi:hypothetical protein